MSSRTRRAFALLLAVPALAVGLAACGDDDGGGGGDKLSAADYRTEVKKICAENKKAADGLKEPTGPNAGEIKQFLQDGLKISKDSNEKLKDLTPPDDLKATHDETIEYRDEVVAFLEDLVGKIDDDADQAALQEVLTPLQQRSEEFDKRADELAGKLGVPECAEA